MAMMYTPTIPPPDPDTRTPKFRLPNLSCDAHCHIFGPGANYPYAPERSYTPPDAPLEDFRALHAKLGVERAVIVNASVHGTDNTVALDAIDLPEYADMLAKLPLSYTIDHMGRVRASEGLDQLPFRILIELMQRDEKCWVKICGSERVSSAGPPFTDAVPFARKIVETAPDRVIWGTDWPHPNVKVMPNDGDLVDLIPLFAPETEFQQKILVDNPARLFEFDT